ncbi:hypothetical protein BDQ12DRAFT_656505 [Crucibulum laeve]|uniref:DUF6534 domain-containing protein n=1 Tax=Crucibulum laeve TaxID=68775 RepID=A0A5C3LQE8_9AGAR|nr:hypothetical protein BDQ12DRAFT_656505 [Crucibulum laeve]
MGTFDETLGAASIGFSISCVVFGVLTTQVFVYFQRYHADRPMYKILVATLWIIELLDQILIGYSVYYYTVTHYAEPLVLINGSIIWTLIIQIPLGCLVGTIVKLAFAMRVWRFSHKNVWITGLILALILAQMGLGIVYTVRSFELNRLSAASKLKVIASLSLGSGMITDIIIAASLCYFLQRLRTGFKKSDSLVNRLCIYAINTGVLTSAVSLCTLALYNAHPHAFHFMASYFVLGKLYAISFLATLNTRKVIRGRGTDREGDSSGDGARNTFFMVTQSGRPPRPNPTHTKSMEVGIHQEISVITDLESEDIEAHSHSYTKSKVVG